MKRRALKVWRWLALVAGLVVGLAAVLVTFDFQLLCVTSRPSAADAIVVLGGEPVVRAEYAAHLATNGPVPLVIVSGRGDGEANRRVLERWGVPTNLIKLEGTSRTTQENALYTVQLLRAHGCRRVIIVTSWYHSRRALSCFRHYAPEIEFASAPVARTQPWRLERGYITSEYLKTVWYVLRWQILPW